MTVPDLRQSCVEAGARALASMSTPDLHWSDLRADQTAAAVLDAIVPVLAEAVKELGGEGWPVAITAPMPGEHVRFVSLDAVLALLADVQGERVAT